MAVVNVSIQEEQVERVQKILAGIDGGARRALYNAVNRTQATVRTETTRAITGVYEINRQNLRAGTNIKSSIYDDSNGVIGEITFAGTKLPLYRFNVTPKIPTVTQRYIPVNINGLWKTVQESAPVSASIKRGGARKQSDNAFIAKMDSGHIGVFERIHSDSNYSKIRERMGLATAQMAANSVVIEDVERKAQETLNKRLEHEMTRILNGWR